jgi:hypothetical protein
LIHWLVRPRSEGDYEHKIQRFFSPLIAKEALIKKVLKRVILGFADQQLVTGLAILITGYMKYCSISVYHFNVVTDLAWLSSVTHLLSVSCLRDYFVEHPGIRDARAIGMVCFFIMLVVPCVFEVHHTFSDDLSAPLRCRFSSLRGVPNTPWGLFLFVLLVSYPLTILRLYPENGFYGWCENWIIKKPDALLDIGESCTRKALELKHMPRLTFRQRCYKWANYIATPVCLATWVVATGAKFLFIHQCGYIYYVFGIIELFLGLLKRAKLYPLDGSESTWGFGQLVPLLLIAIPLLSTFELFYGMYPNFPRFCTI